MLQYKSIVLHKLFRKAIEESINETLNDMTQKGWTFVSIAGTPGYGFALVFSKEM